MFFAPWLASELEVPLLQHIQERPIVSYMLNFRLASLDGFSLGVLNFFPLTMCVPAIIQILRPLLLEKSLVLLF
jgi:hypothetical protein